MDGWVDSTLGKEMPGSKLKNIFCSDMYVSFRSRHPHPWRRRRGPRGYRSRIWRH